MGRKFNVLNHQYVPQHIRLSREEARRILGDLNISLSELPWILSSDPAARAAGAKPGDVLLIIRKSQTAGESIAFRLVIPG
ncbi:MAG: DNA-directed RNA polymerase subunit H [Thermoproteales archaeon]|nr:DNA-directed RNA polymerase subunit H [Thermoproteales archaeon]RLE66800.1 MAG: DNA-directed RNA polymerase subunit H [Thermoprotei archaeon]